MHIGHFERSEIEPNWLGFNPSSYIDKIYAISEIITFI